MAEYEKLEKDIHDLVVSYPFTPVTGKPTWEDRERFEEERIDIALKVKNSYKWSKRRGMVREVMTDEAYLAECDDLTDDDLDEVEQPPDIPVGSAGLTKHALEEAKAALVVEKCNWAKLQGFRSGFAENFMNSFPKKYWNKLKQGKALKWAGRVPMDFIEEFERHIPMDEVQMQWMKDKVLRGWEEDDLEPFGARLKEERDEVGRLSPPIKITDEELNIHYMNQIWKRTDVFGLTIMEEWTNRDPDEKTLEHSIPFFEKKWKARENFEAAGGVVNQFAAVNAVEEVQQQLEEKLEQQRTEHAAAISELKKQSDDKLDRLTEAVMVLANAKKAEEDAEPPRRRKRARRYDDDYDYSSSSEDEATPPRRRRRTEQRRSNRRERDNRRQNDGAADRGTRFTIPRAPGADLEWKPGAEYKRGMKFNSDWSPGTKDTYLAARRRFMSTGTEEGLLEKLANQDRMLAWARDGNSRYNEKQIKEAREKTIKKIKEKRSNKSGEEE